MLIHAFMSLKTVVVLYSAESAKNVVDDDRMHNRINDPNHVTQGYENTKTIKGCV